MPNMEILDNNSELDILIEYDGEFGEFYEVPSAVKSVNGQTGDVVLDAEDVGAIETESDPVFVNSPAYNISAEDIDSWDSKSDFSGDYNDLANKPTIPTQASDVHALPDDTTYVSSVDGKTGSVTVIPAGGSTGQVLAKASETDRDVEWATPSGGGDTWRVIADMTTTEEVLSINITQDSNGNSFSLKEFRALAIVPACTQASNGQWGANEYWFDGTGNLNTSTSRHGSIAMKLNPDNTASTIFEPFAMGVNNNAYFTAVNAGWYNGNMTTPLRTYPNGITAIKLRQTNTSYTLPAGTKVTVYGVDL